MTRSPQVPAWLRDPRGQPVVLPFTYAAVLLVSEVGLVQNHHVLAGAIVDALLVLILVNAVQDPAPRGAPFEAADHAMSALAVVALSRVIVIGLPLRDASTAVATLGVALLVGGATLAIARFVSLPIRALLVWRVPRLQNQAALAGFVLGLAAYLVGAPRLWSSGASSGRVFLALVAAFAAAGVEELLFRGLLLVSLRRVAARAGLLASCGLFAATYLSAGPACLVLLIAIAGVFFSSTVARSGSLAGSLVGHALLALGAGGLWPAVFGVRHSHLGDSTVIAVLLALVMVGVAARAIGAGRLSGSADALAEAAPASEELRPSLPEPAAVASPPPESPAPEGEPAVEAGAVTTAAVEAGAVTTAAVDAGAVTTGAADPGAVTTGRSLRHSDLETVLACVRRLGLPELLDSAPGRERDLCLAAISQLVLSSDSSGGKPPTTSMTHSTTGSETGVVDLTSDAFAGAMRWLGERKRQIESQLVTRHLTPDSVPPAYDIRVADGEVYGVLSDSRALPLAAQRHAGDPRDPAALPAAIRALRARFRLRSLIVTCDGQAERQADLTLLSQAPGWIVALSAEGSDASPSLAPGETLIEDRPEGKPALVLRAGGSVVQQGTEGVLRIYREVADPELRFDLSRTADPVAWRGQLTAALLSAYVAWHLRQAWADLLLEDRGDADGPTPGSLASVLDALSTRRRTAYVRSSGDAVLSNPLSEPTALRVRAMSLIGERVPALRWPSETTRTGAE